MNLEVRVKEFRDMFDHRDTERWIRAIAEEAGEVAGAFNKWQDGNTVKPRTREDVLEEMSQLLACVLCTADKLGMPVPEFMETVDHFLQVKAEQIRKIRASNKGGK